MDHRDIAVLMDGIAPVLRGYVEKAFEPIGARMLALEQRFADLPAPRDPDQVMILRLVEETVAKLPPPEPGKDADPALVAELVGKAVAALPPAKDGEPGTSVTVDDLAPLVAAEVAKAVAGLDLPAGVHMVEVERMLAEQVKATVEALPPAQPGKSADPAEIAAMVATEVSRAVADIPPARDGIGLAGALIDREGCLVVTLTDGSTKALGAVVGKDVDVDAVADMVKAEVAKLPVPKDGQDGVGFDDMDLVDLDGDLVLRFTRGDVVKDFPLPITTYRGVWVERDYQKGASVTFGGSSWIAERATKDKPDTPNCGWRLAVKRGRDGASAFDVARKAGFKGTEREWLDSLRPQPVKPVKVS